MKSGSVFLSTGWYSGKISQFTWFEFILYMSKSDYIELEGVVKEKLPNTTFTLS